MTLKEKIYSINKEASLYYSQGMYEEALIKYKTLLKLVSSFKGLKNKEETEKKIRDKIGKINEKLNFYEKEGAHTDVSEDKKEIIKRLFSDVKDDPEYKKFEEALTLAKFGQFSDAVKEMSVFLKNTKLKNDAARNIIKCYEAMDKIEEIIPIVNKWKKENIFSEKDGNFFIESSKAASLVEEEQNLPAETQSKEPETYAPEIMEIDSVGIKLSGNDVDSDPVELDVSFQTGNHLSLIISSKEKRIIDNLDVGVKLNDMCFYSPIAVFKSTGIVLSKHQINSGPKKGDWCLDLEIKNPS
jgi:tetratricopeptide (TPR) repeat protein